MEVTDYFAHIHVYLGLLVVIIGHVHNHKNINQVQFKFPYVFARVTWARSVLVLGHVRVKA